MNKNSNLKNLENEYDSEIDDYKISIIDLKKVGVSTSALSSEIYLYSIYGDKIENLNTNDDFDEKNKKIEKLTDADKVENQDYLKTCNEIDNNDFDTNLESLMMEIKNEK